MIEIIPALVLTLITLLLFTSIIVINKKLKRSQGGDFSFKKTASIQGTRSSLKVSFSVIFFPVFLLALILVVLMRSSYFPAFIDTYSIYVAIFFITIVLTILFLFTSQITKK